MSLKFFLMDGIEEMKSPFTNMKNYDNPEEVSPTIVQANCEECTENNIEPVFDQKKLPRRFEVYREFLTKIRGLRT
jgi:hypothetical protein